MDNKYKNGKIYTIRFINDNSLIYVGSTVQPLYKRFIGHKTDSKQPKNENMLVYKKMNETNINDWYIELYEDFLYERKEQLTQREGQVIRGIGTLNKNITGRTPKEYVEDNKEHIQEQRKEYREANKERINKKKKEYYFDNKDIINKKKKEYYFDNKDKKKEYREVNKYKNQEWREVNKDKIKENYLKNKEHILEKAKENYLKKKLLKEEAIITIS